MDKKLNIGVDADGIIFNLEKFQLEKGLKYFNRDIKNINKEAYDVADIFNVSRTRRQLFWIRNIYNYCMHSELIDGVIEEIKAWQEEGHKVYNITSRVYVDQKGIIGNIFRWMLEERYRREGIVFDGIDYCSEKNSASDKMIACSKRQIDIMFEDKIDNIEAIANNTPTKVVAVRNLWNQHFKHGKVDFIGKDFKESRKIVEKVHTTINEDTKDLEYNEKRKYSMSAPRETNLHTQIEFYKRFRENIKSFGENKEMPEYDFSKKEEHEKNYKFLYKFIIPPFKHFYNPKFFNTELIPYQKGVIFVSNHLNYLDQFAIIPALGDRPVHFLAASELKEMKRGLLYDKVGCIFIDRKSMRSGMNSTLAMARILAEGGDILIFPEGTRNNGNKFEKAELLEMHEGPIKLAQVTGAPIVPIGITDNWTFRSKSLLVRIGKPFIVSVDADINQMRDKMQESVRELVRENAAYIEDKGHVKIKKMVNTNNEEA